MQAKIITLFWTSATSLQTKPKQKFAFSVHSMWLTYVKNRTTSGHSQPPHKLNQNKRKVCHDTKKPPMTQNRKKNTHNTPNPK
jgi:hypothetical protein